MNSIMYSSSCTNTRNIYFTWFCAIGAREKDRWEENFRDPNSAMGLYRYYSKYLYFFTFSQVYVTFENVTFGKDKA